MSVRLIKKENAIMDIGSVLSRAWNTIWKHKVLWIFGILAGCSGAGGNAPNLRTTYQTDASPQMEQFFNQFTRLPDWQIALIVIILILVTLVLVLLAIFLGTMGRIGLIRGTLQVDRGAAALSFGDLFSESLPYFWRVFGLGLLIGLAAFVVAIALAIFFIAGTVLTLGIGTICLIPLICLIIPIGWFISIVIEQANIAIVAENLGIMDGLRRGWEVARGNLGPVIVMGLILYIGVSLIGGLIIGLPVFLIALPAVFGLMSESAGASRNSLLIAGLCFVAYLPVWILLTGILYSFIESAWTLTFLDLTRRPRAPQAELTPVE
jgi:hypothetical protein